ncbi:uncharacterized protein A4U43_C04F18450 [Asparagus officinalis]|uniref:Uncharacterized protein n=1 Tax=Asparagus officinalis TaxID=4686 RepID=A0A5P1F1V9_ASPOF|nr:uncharacterized protein A4U43_C04F18450 [Asparagus officinalis]
MASSASSTLPPPSPPLPLSAAKKSFLHRVLPFLLTANLVVGAIIKEFSGSKKRKRDSLSLSKKSKPFGSKPAKFQSTGGFKKDPKSFKSKPIKSYDAFEKKEPTTPREKQLSAKEMAEERKKKRKPNYNIDDPVGDSGSLSETGTLISGDFDRLVFSRLIQSLCG